jgi:multidrug efflux pump subunit AcrB
MTRRIAAAIGPAADDAIVVVENIIAPRRRASLRAYAVGNGEVFPT